MNALLLHSLGSCAVAEAFAERQGANALLASATLPVGRIFSKLSSFSLAPAATGAAALSQETTCGAARPKPFDGGLRCASLLG